MDVGGRGRSYVIVGNGIAGVTAAETLRAEDGAASITIIAGDTHPVYYRPALKDFLGGRLGGEKLWARSHSFYHDLRVRYIADQVVAIDGRLHVVWLASGRQVGFDRLLLANGALANTLACPGMHLAGVTTLRSVSDYQKVLDYLGSVRHVVVVGSGTLALESVETLRGRGLQVTHLVRHQTLWSEVLDATASDLVLQQEEHDEVDVLPGQEVAEIVGKDGRVSGVITRQGLHISCELVLIAIGIQPVIDFIARSGIACGRGVRVDASMRTSMPDVFAAGDVVETHNPLTGRARPLGQWYPAIQQARAAAYSMLDMLDTSSTAGTGINYLNATFLYGLDFASIGLTNIVGHPYHALIAEPQPRRYQKVLLRNGIPVGWLSLGDRAPALAFKRAIDHGVNLLPVAPVLFEQRFRLDDWLDTQGVPPPVLNVSKVGEGRYG